MSDMNRAVAALALDHGLLAPRLAVQMITDAQGSDAALLKMVMNEIRDLPLLEAIAKELRVGFIDLYAPQNGFRVEVEVLRRAEEDVLKQHSAIPLVDDAGKIVVATANTNNLDLREYISARYGNVALVLAGREQVQARLSLSVSDMMTLPTSAVDEEIIAAPQKAAVATPAQRSPLVGWVSNILDAAVAQGVSDIHFEQNMDSTMLARLRVDGVLRQIDADLRGREAEVFGIVLNRAGMDAANLLVPQDGQFSFQSAGRNIDVRVAMTATVNGPKIVMRLLDSANVRRRLADMGFSPEHIDVLRSATRMNRGTVFVSGPTGSGKTTTLYALIREASSVERNVCTIEDPVEYRLPLVNQVQIRTIGDKKLSFADALKNTLRMDPDVILIGEVRDAETAKAALDAANTGHLVFSTVHANSALNVFSRLIEIGAPAYLVADAVSLSVAQRLIRRLHDCATPEAPTDKIAGMYERMGIDLPERVMTPRGCEGCSGTGYRGRIALVEVLTPSEALKEMITSHAPLSKLLECARADGFMTLSDHAASAVTDGITSIEEAVRLLQGVED